MNFWKRYFGDLFLPLRFYLAMGACIFCFLVAYYFTPFLAVAKTLFYVLLALCAVDYIILVMGRSAPTAQRDHAERFSNGNDNSITLTIINHRSFDISVT